MFDLYEVVDCLVYMYFGGMRRKFDLVMSLLGNLIVLFLDELIIGLDL